MTIIGYILSSIALFIAGLVAFLYKYKAFDAQHQEEPLIDPVEPLKLPVEATKIPKATTMTKREKLYDTAYNCRARDMSPLDRAPDNLACMESLDGVFLEAFGEHLLSPENRLSTQRGYQAMLKDSRLELIKNEDALPGDIVISPTGSSTKGFPHGHTGIRGKTAYMSNDSTTGLWTANYNLANWDLVFHKTLGFPVIHFRVVGDVV